MPTGSVPHGRHGRRLSLFSCSRARRYHTMARRIISAHVLVIAIFASSTPVPKDSTWFQGKQRNPPRKAECLVYTSSVPWHEPSFHSYCVSDLSVGLVRDLAAGLKSVVSGRENTTRNVSVDDSPGERGHTDAGVNLGSVHHGGVTPEDIVRVGDSGNNSNVHDGGVTPENIVQVGDSSNISNTHGGSVPHRGMLKGVASVVKNVTQGAREGPKNIVRSITSEVKNVTLEATDAVEETVQSGVETVAPEGKCYDGLGCFQNTAPWWVLGRPLPNPQQPTEIDTRFYLYTRLRPERYYVRSWPEVTMEGSDYNPDRVTVFIVHGFSSNGNVTWMDQMKNATLEKMDANVILVDWGKGASLLNYFQVSSNTRIVGAELGRLGRYLVSFHKTSPSKFHLVGHSLGAHICSYAANNITEVGRITALDPAQPLFEGFDNEVHIDPSDALFVEVLHTDAEPFLPFLGFGMIGAVGHVDFYLNGGHHQPGCSLLNLIKPNITSILDLAFVLVEALSDYVTCPHGRAYEIWTAALEYDNCTFWGKDKTNQSRFDSHINDEGFEPDSSEARQLLQWAIPIGLQTIRFPVRGTFNVPTSGAEPYCLMDLGADFLVYDWKGTVETVIKPPAQWHFKFAASKRILLKNNMSGDVKLPNEVPVKAKKLFDVEKLLINHFGEEWRGLEHLSYYRDLITNISVMDNDDGNGVNEELSEMSYCEEEDLRV
uniref:Lipase domain-containing protein n=1 Tax=Timema tahoe TaxID=61484 RepID=A0A7R9FFS4_9NEOP|nr:unnamed protein product [Timema tahoe]